MNYPDALGFLINELEGRGPENVSGDPGGLTYQGVTQTTWVNLGLPGLVSSAQDQQISDIYWNNYWIPVGADRLPSGLDLAVFQAGVNVGPQKALKWLQSILGVDQDGVFGPQTEAAAQNYTYGLENLIGYFLDIQKQYYIDRTSASVDPLPVSFLPGLENRVYKAREKALSEMAAQSEPDPGAADLPTLTGAPEFSWPWIIALIVVLALVGLGKAFL